MSSGDIASEVKRTSRPSFRSHLLVVKAVKRMKRSAESRKLANENERLPLLQEPVILLPFLQASKKLLLSNVLNVLLLAIPFAIAAGYMDWGDGTVFALTCLSILPLASLLGEATEQVAMHTSDTLGGLLNATFGNATELIVSIFALKKGLITVVQTSLLGSILSNTLLVFGCACLIGGFRQRVLRFNQTAANSNVGLLLLAILGITVPTLMNAIGQHNLENDLALSRVISVCLLVLYGLYIYFQLYTHRAIIILDNEDDIENGEDEEDEEGEELLFSLQGAVVWLGIITVLIAWLSEILTDSIEGTAQNWGLPDTFIGFVLIPVVGNAAEHATAVVMANQGKMNLALAVALGSSTQIALFVIPFMVLMGWAMGQPMDLTFGSFEMGLCLLSTIICAFVVQNGKSNWLEGALLLATYLIIAVAFYYYKEPPHFY